MITSQAQNIDGGTNGICLYFLSSPPNKAQIEERCMRIDSFCCQTSKNGNAITRQPEFDSQRQFSTVGAHNGYQ